jgi:TRAP-type C4-dicarboxylate transport system permease small subunit
MLDRTLHAVTRGIERCLAVALIGAVLLSFVNAIGRYGFDWALAWGDEVQVYVMIWMAFLGAAVVSWREMHLRMDILFHRFPRPVRLLVQSAELASLAALCGFVFYQSAHYAKQMFLLGRLSDVARIPMWLPNSGVALGFGLMALIALVRLVRLLRRREPARRADARETAA